MMAGNFQQMGNAGGNPMMMQQQAQGLNQNPNQHLQILLLQQIRAQSQQPPVGWRAAFSDADRLAFSFQLVTQLRLANPATSNLTELCRDALKFEKQSFDSAPDKDAYVKLMNGKLAQLTGARTINSQQMQAAQQQQQQIGMANQAGGMGQPFQQGMQQLQNMQHLQQQMQPSPMQGQQQPQQIPMGMGNNIMGQTMPPNAQFQMNMQQQQQQHQGQMQAQQGGQQKPQPQMSPAEQQMIFGMARQLIANASEADKQMIRQRAQASVDPAQWERMQASHIDPVAQFYQREAIRQYRARRAQIQAQGQSGQGMAMAINRPQGAVPMQPQRSGNPNPMAPQPQQGQQHGIPGNPEFAFLDPQQQNQIPQEGNQLGMQPSLSQQGSTTPQNMAGLPVQAITPNQQRMAQNAQMRQQQFNAQQQAQAQVQAQEKALRVQMALQGQPGGLGGMPPNQSPAMNTLNAPMAGTPQQNLNGKGAPVSQPGPSQFGQPIDPRFAGMNQRPGMNGQMAFPNGMTAEQRQKLSQLPPEKLTEVMAKWHEQRVAMQNQANGLAGGMAGGGQMMQNPGGQQPQPGQQGMPNPMTQFMQNGQPMQRPPSQMQSGMTPQQQALLRQQMQRQQMQNAGAPPHVPTGDMPGGQAIDQVEFPSAIFSLIPRNLIPQGLTKWGALKQWIATNGQNNGLDVQGVMEKISLMQRQHMGQIMRNRQMQQQNQQRMAAGLLPTGLQPGQPGQPVLTPQMAQQLAQMPSMQQQISPQDIENARTRHSGRWTTLSDDQIKQNLMVQRRNQHIHFLRQQQQHQMQQQQNQRFNQQQMGQMPNMPQMPGQNIGPNGMQRAVGPPPPQQGQPGVPPQGMKRPQPNQPGVPAKQQPQPPMETKQTPQQRAAKPTQPTSSPAQPPNSKKRASSDDVVEVPNPNAQVNRPQMQPGQQGMLRPVTQEQLAAMPEDKRQKYMQLLATQQRQRQMAAMGPQMGPQPTQADLQEFRRIRQEEQIKWKPSPPVKMSPEERAQAVQLLATQATRINQVFSIALRWFAMEKDEQRLRSYFNAQHSINDQFEDGARTQRPKAALSMKTQEIQSAMAIATSIVSDVAAKYPEMMKPRPAGPGQAQPPNAVGPSGQGQQQQSMTGPSPLNAANLQQQQQALSAAQKGQNKQQMQRASMSNKAPPASTTAHAPNTQMMGQTTTQAAKAQTAAQHGSPANQPFAVNSPQGVPAMYGPSKIDQGQLRLPPSKKRKADGGMNSSGSTPVQAPKSAPGQNGQNQSQPMVKQESQREQKPQANGKHQEQQPRQPEQQGFICQDRDCEGHLAPFATEAELQKHVKEQHVVVEAIPFLMGVMGDYLNLDEIKKGTAGEAAPMKQGAIHPGTKPSPSTKAKDMKPPQDPWAASSVNPQDLMAIFKPFESGANGAISNIDAYRSITPNDTPESTESSRGSDALNSDITDGTALEINMQFADDFDPFSGEDLDAFTITEVPKPVDPDPRPIGQRGDNEMVYNELPGSEADDIGGWDDLVQWGEPDQPYAFDSSLFEIDDGNQLVN